MSYLVFARKYRPQTFEQVVQQSHVTQTLTNAITAGRVAHAILFSGPRGTGKTTVARILAKAMNCDQGPTAQPCNRCQSCKEITAGSSGDVFEIDGASNNSVDQVRELRENLKYMPVHSRFKIYIIDEVHMLSLAAFNALLKTLEEPPEHIMFMFATTEAHKIPITILSRCQRHDLRRIDGEAIAGHLQFICDSEAVEIDEASISLIAREAGGSMRDSLSLLDHVLACARGPVTAGLIGELLGVVDRQHLFDLSRAVLEGNLQGVLAGIDAVWRNGYEFKRFYADLVAHFHHLVLVKQGPRTAQLADLPSHEIDLMRDQVDNVPTGFLLQIFESLFQAEPAIKLSSQPRLGLEMVFLKLFQTAPALSIDTLIDHLDRLQEKIGCPPTPLDPKISDPKPSAPKPSDGSARPVQAADAADASQPQAAAPVEADGGQGDQPVEDIDALWEQVVREISEQKPSLAGFLGKCTLRSGRDGVLELEVRGNKFTLKSVTKHRQIIETQCNTHLNKPVALEIVANFEDQATHRKEKKKISRLKQEALGHPLVMEALELFDGRVIDIKVP
jgi:DNA polymerase-3 subunit gamma/tau